MTLFAYELNSYKLKEKNWQVADLLMITLFGYLIHCFVLFFNYVQMRLTNIVTLIQETVEIKVVRVFNDCSMFIHYYLIGTRIIIG